LHLLSNCLIMPKKGKEAATPGPAGPSNQEQSAPASEHGGSTMEAVNLQLIQDTYEQNLHEMEALRGSVGEAQRDILSLSQSMDASRSEVRDLTNLLRARFTREDSAPAPVATPPVAIPPVAPANQQPKSPVTSEVSSRRGPSSEERLARAGFQPAATHLATTESRLTTRPPKEMTWNEIGDTETSQLVARVKREWPPVVAKVDLLDHEHRRKGTKDPWAGTLPPNFSSLSDPLVLVKLTSAQQAFRQSMLPYDDWAWVAQTRCSGEFSNLCATSFDGPVKSWIVFVARFLVTLGRDRMRRACGYPLSAFSAAPGEHPRSILTRLQHAALGLPAFYSTPDNLLWLLRCHIDKYVPILTQDLEGWQGTVRDLFPFAYRKLDARVRDNPDPPVALGTTPAAAILTSPAVVAPGVATRTEEVMWAVCGPRGPPQQQAPRMLHFAPRSGPAPQAEANTVCYNCRGTGHFQRDCPRQAQNGKPVPTGTPRFVRLVRRMPQAGRPPYGSNQASRGSAPRNQPPTRNQAPRRVYAVAEHVANDADYDNDPDHGEIFEILEDHNESTQQAYDDLAGAEPLHVAPDEEEFFLGQLSEGPMAIYPHDA